MVREAVGQPKRTGGDGREALNALSVQQAYQGDDEGAEQDAVQGVVLYL